MTIDIESDVGLKAQIDMAVVEATASREHQAWHADLASFFAEIAEGIPQRLREPAFLLRLWDDNPVSATGMGSVRMAPALADAEFCEWFATTAAQPLATDDVAAEAQLVEFYAGLVDRLKVLCKRTPRLKIHRVLCALHPDHFTTVADEGKLAVLHQKMGGEAREHPVRTHKAVRRRIDALLGPVATDDPRARVRRICLPWQLYEHVADTPSVSSGDPAPVPGPSSSLVPLPASRRRKGLTAMKGYFQTLLDVLPELEEGLSKEEFGAVIKQGNPELADSSLPASINVVAREFDLCRLDSGTYRLSARGINLLRTQDPDELADHLLTRVLGVDHVLKALEKAPVAKLELVSLLQSVHPGWTSAYAPSALLSWLASFGVVEAAGKRELQLTRRGRDWLQQVNWEPERLQSRVLVDPASATHLDTVTDADDEIDLPELAALIGRLESATAGRLVFARSLVEQLHAGLWCHPVRHFAVLSGLSGSGKTQLALHYARALCGIGADDHGRVCVIPVQPGWYDASPLLGYVNPLHDTTYRSAPFLDLLIRAEADPDRPYVAILDEMNLSHPEQYLAPVLSAMETQGWLDLHGHADDTAGVPRRLRYPANLAIIGTLNMDETTHGLSDKVLDRAFTLEFWAVDVHDFPGWNAATLSPTLRQAARDVLGRLSAALAPERLHFGWRTIDDVVRYLAFRAASASSETEALDEVIYARVLPKLRGEASARFQKALQAAHEVLREHQLQRCCEKLQSLKDDLSSTGSARFWR